MSAKKILRKGMTVREVDALLGPNAADEDGGNGRTVRTYEMLVVDEEHPRRSRLASADVSFRGGKATSWRYEVALIAETVAKIRAGDRASIRAAGLKP